MDSALAGVAELATGRPDRHARYRRALAWLAARTIQQDAALARRRVQDRLDGAAAELKLDMTAYATCIAGNKHDAEINADMEAGRSLGIEGTPSFLLGRTTGTGQRGQMRQVSVRTKHSVGVQSWESPPPRTQADAPNCFTRRLRAGLEPGDPRRVAART